MDNRVLDRVVFGRMWWCGDDECDCTCPEIVLVEKLESGYSPPWRYVYTTLSEGEFVTSGCEPGEREAQTQWLKEACAWYGVENFYAAR